MNVRCKSWRKSLLSYVRAGVRCTQQHSVPGSADVVVVAIALLSLMFETHAGTTWSVHNKSVCLYRLKMSQKSNGRAHSQQLNNINSSGPIDVSHRCPMAAAFRRTYNQFSMGHSRNSSTAITIELEMSNIFFFRRGLA